MNRIIGINGMDPAAFNETGRHQTTVMNSGVNFSDVLGGTIREQVTQSIMANRIGRNSVDATQGIPLKMPIPGAENTLVAVSDPGEMSGVQLMLFMMLMLMQNGESGNDFASIMQMVTQMISPPEGSQTGESLSDMMNTTRFQNNPMMSVNPETGVGHMVEIALSQVGTHEKNRDGSYGSGNFTKYGAWYGMDGQPWCAMFVSWAADQAGMLNSAVPRHASTSMGVKAYKDKGLYAPRSSGYIPKEGDAIYFSSNGRMQHVGIVVAFDPTTQRVYTVEGNTNNAVRIRHYDLSNPRIDGFGRNGGTGFGRVPNNSTSGTGANTV